MPSPLLAYLVIEPHPFLIDFGNFWGTELGIRFYPLAYLTGFLISYAALQWQARRGYVPLSKAEIQEFIYYVALFGVMLGGRLGYCILYKPELFLNPLQVLEVWKGGMASHGGIIGVILVMFFYARAKKIPFYRLSDAGVLFVPLDLAIGRCANFLNGELWGRATDSSWGVIFTESTPVHGVLVPRYPSQLFEACLEGLLLEVILLAVRFSTRRSGVVSLTFMAGYAILRIIGEQFREPDIGIDYWYGLTRGQILSIVMLTITAVLIIGLILFPGKEQEVPKPDELKPSVP